MKKNTLLSICEKKIFTITNDYQEEIEVHVLQGEYNKASLNYCIVNFLVISKSFKRHFEDRNTF
uniref:Putative hsp70 n=1 Tax=Borrelia lonestari TaxID=38876 RepID=A4ZYZ4_9SPIR|nr:putative hsp70 [Borrelia lonestari]